MLNGIQPMGYEWDFWKKMEIPWIIMDSDGYLTIVKKVQDVLFSMKCPWNWGFLFKKTISIARVFEGFSYN
jgi:hypothetical protein